MSLGWVNDIACHNAADGIDQNIDDNQREGHDVGAARGKARSHDLTANLWWRLPGPLWWRVLPTGINARRFSGLGSRRTGLQACRRSHFREERSKVDVAREPGGLCFGQCCLVVPAKLPEAIAAQRLGIAPVGVFNVHLL
jgi:hypothetical protein